MLFKFVFIFFLSFSFLYSKEIVLECKMNYGISGENDETDIEFKNIKKIDESQILYLDLENNWLFNQSIQDYKNSSIQVSDINVSINDSTIFTLAKYEKDRILINKHIIELNRYSGFLKYNFETSYERIYRTGYCSLAKKKLF